MAANKPKGLYGHAKKKDHEAGLLIGKKKIEAAQKKAKKLAGQKKPEGKATPEAKSEEIVGCKRGACANKSLSAHLYIYKRSLNMR